LAFGDPNPADPLKHAFPEAMLSKEKMVFPACQPHDFKHQLLPGRPVKGLIRA